jgi:hypothetical protein
MFRNMMREGRIRMQRVSQQQMISALMIHRKLLLAIADAVWQTQTRTAMERQIVWMAVLRIRR